jgi:hypothetical protein
VVEAEVADGQQAAVKMQLPLSAESAEFGNGVRLIGLLDRGTVIQQKRSQHWFMSSYLAEGMKMHTSSASVSPPSQATSISKLSNSPSLS